MGCTQALEAGVVESPVPHFAACHSVEYLQPSAQLLLLKEVVQTPPSPHHLFLVHFINKQRGCYWHKIERSERNTLYLMVNINKLYLNYLGAAILQVV